MPLQLFNSLGKKKEEFKPIREGEARVYTCGPTVYNYAHIGNLRSYVFADTLRRTLEWNGYKVKQVINITDVGHLTSDGDEGDDKMMKALKREGKPLTLEGLKEVADKYTVAFLQDLQSLNIEPPSVMPPPRASDHITEDIELIQILEQKGFAYRTRDGMYFDTAKFPSYGKLGNINLAGLKAGARVEINSEKRNSIDFTLWKFSTNEWGWENPFGKGFPGWHVECSAMSRKYLGQPFDIHTGGIDHIPIHHQNEIAQSEAAYGVPLTNYWMHNEFVNVPSGKMAKSDENFITLATLKERGIHPLAYRYFLLTAHYRSPINFSWEALEAAQNAYLKLLLAFNRLPKNERPEETDRDRLRDAMNDDLGSPATIALLWEEVKAKNRVAILECDRVLGLDIEKQAAELAEKMKAVPEEIKEKAARRDAARRSKNFAEADALRDEIRAAGFELHDTGEETLILKKI